VLTLPLSHTLNQSQREDARKFIQENLATIGKQAGFKSFELVQRVHLCPIEWTPENGFLTGLLKFTLFLLYSSCNETEAANCFH
jgi:hypothetical protein